MPQVTSTFTMLLIEVTKLLVAETNWYYHHYFSASLLPDMNDITFQATIVQMRYCIQNGLMDCWAAMEQFYTPSCSSTMKQDRFFRILDFLHFTDNSWQSYKKSKREVPEM
jgi:hypothetical protein